MLILYIRRTLILDLQFTIHEQEQEHSRVTKSFQNTVTPQCNHMVLKRVLNIESFSKYSNTKWRTDTIWNPLQNDFIKKQCLKILQENKKKYLLEIFFK